ncbi:MAG: hypothetical protein ACLFS3_01585 [Candidatus Aenigmatarchaeota archaeon]
MAKYDFLGDENLQKKLEERQMDAISRKKKDEVKKSRAKKKKKDGDQGPEVYTKEDGQIGGIIYPKKKKEDSESDTLKNYMKDEEKEKKRLREKRKAKEKEERERNSASAADILNQGGQSNSRKKSEEEDLPIKLHHTGKTKVGTEDRPEPAKTEKPQVTAKKNKERKKESDDDQEEALDKIWQ